MLHFIRVFTVCKSTCLGVSGIQCVKENRCQELCFMFIIFMIMGATLKKRNFLCRTNLELDRGLTWKGVLITLCQKLVSLRNVS